MIKDELLMATKQPLTFSSVQTACHLRSCLLISFQNLDPPETLHPAVSNATEIGGEFCLS